MLTVLGLGVQAMVPRRTLTLGVAFGLAVILLSSCDTVHVHRRPQPGQGGWAGNGTVHHEPGIGNGPPAHAKAHGYRRKQVCGYELVYDANWGLYVVVGIDDCYYHEDHFYRLRNDVWEISLRADSGWSPVSVTMLPPGLQKKAGQRVRAKAAQVAAATKAPGPDQAETPGKANGKDNGKGYAKGNGKH